MFTQIHIIPWIHQHLSKLRLVPQFRRPQRLPGAAQRLRGGAAAPGQRGGHRQGQGGREGQGGLEGGGKDRKFTVDLGQNAEKHDENRDLFMNKGLTGLISRWCAIYG